MRLVVEGLSGSASASNGCYAFSERVSKGKQLYEQDTGAHVLIWDGEAWTLADSAAPTEKVWAFVCTDDGKLPVGVPSESWTSGNTRPNTLLKMGAIIAATSMALAAGLSDSDLSYAAA